MILPLENKVIVITWGGWGLGKSFVTQLVKEHKTKVVVLDKNTEQLDTLAKELSEIQTYPCDVSSRENVQSVFDRILASTHIDILINNAGIYYEAPTQDHSEWIIQKMFAVNTEGPILCTKAVLAHMKEKKAGQILNVVSTAGVDKCPERWVYAATKAAVASFTESAAVEFEPFGIRVMGIYPGGMNTNIFDTAWVDTTGADWMMDKESVARIGLFMLQQPADVRIEKLVVRKFNPNRAEYIS